jgi:histidyl-tRNA synthetase
LLLKVIICLTRKSASGFFAIFLQKLDNSHMSIVSPRRPSGFPEYSPTQQLAFEGLLTKVRESYQLAGFTPIETPSLELAEVLLAKGGGETEKEVFRFGKGSKDYVLRYDLTVPLARYVAERQNDLVFPFRRSQIQKVWRAERAQKGRAREFYQCDADVVGETDVAVDGEMIGLAATTMRALAVGKCTIKVNNRKILSGIYEALGVAEKSVALMRIIDKLEKVGEKEVRKMLQKTGLGAEEMDMLLKTSELRGAPEAVLADLRGLQLTNDTFVAGIEELERVVEAALAAGAHDNEIIVDCAIARGLDYYTATVFETALDDIPELGSICSGGRFDNLAQYYTRRSLPGVGISIGLTRLFDGLWEAGHFDGTRSTTTEVIVWVGTDNAWKKAGELTADLRQKGISCELSLSDTKITKVLSRASKLGVKAVVIIGENELEKGEVSAKLLETGKQKTYAADDAAQNILKLL